MDAFSAIDQNNLNFRLKSVGVREFMFLKRFPCDIYGVKKGLFDRMFLRGSELNRDSLRTILQEGDGRIFVNFKDHPQFKNEQHKNLQHEVRSISIGEPAEKGKRLINLLTINLAYLYDNPTDDTLLKLQFQSIKVLCKFLGENLPIHNTLYSEFKKQSFHFLYEQPLLSSLFLVGILKMSQMYSEKEIESLFATSYFKDIGMSSIPVEKYPEPKLTPADEMLLASHPGISAKILAGRIPLGPSYLKIIEHHHLFSSLNSVSNYENGDDQEILSGFETMIISVADIIAAMISTRPYRKATNLFDALDLVKILIADQYPQEFKLIVQYFHKFFR